MSSAFISPAPVLDPASSEAEAGAFTVDGRVDAARLRAALEASWRGSAPEPARRAEILATLKGVLSAGWHQIRNRFEEGEATGRKTMQAHAELIDGMLVTLLDFVIAEVMPEGVRTKSERIATMAVGGYGRAEMSPFSDIDLVFVVPYKTTPFVEQVVEWTLYLLWDLGLKVGHATRSADDTVRLAKADMTIRTSIIEARFLWGDRDLYDEMIKRFWSEVVAGTGPEFVDAKLAERDQRHQRMGDSRYLLEPNLKEGQGGLRDLHTLFWIAKYLYGVSDMGELVKLGVLSRSAASKFRRAQDFLWTVRNHLHYLTGRLEDRLTFDVQTQVAARMGYTERRGNRDVERFMKRYFLVVKDVSDLTRILCAVLEEQNQRRSRFRLPGFLAREKYVEGFRLDGNRLNVDSAEEFAKEPIRILKLFHTAERLGLDIHPAALKGVTETLSLVKDLQSDPEANRLFLDLLTEVPDPERALRRLNEAGVFGRFVPDFGRVVAQMQFDMYHVYTVDEHTIRAVGLLHKIESGAYADEMPIASTVVHQLQSRRALYVAVLLHDVAKGRGGDHSELGGNVAENLGPRFGLTAEETENVAWLVRKHLHMTRVAFRRNIDDPQTIKDFVAEVQSPERLKMLLVLTCADIRATNPKIWNNWKATLLRSLYEAALDQMQARDTDDLTHAARVATMKERLAQRLADLPEEDRGRLLDLGYRSYWLGYDLDSLEAHARFMYAAGIDTSDIAIDVTVSQDRAASELLIYAPDHPGLFARIAGAVAAEQGSIVAARINTMTNGMALDSFTLQNVAEAAFDRDSKIGRLKATIRGVLDGTVNLPNIMKKARGELPTRTEVFAVPPRVIVDNSASKTHTLIEVNGRDRPGFLYDVTSCLSRQNVQISAAKVATYGERAVDVFYIKDVFGMKIEHKAKLKSLQSALVEMLGGYDATREKRTAKSPR